jgi:signal transduction histidine kinase
VSTYQWDTTSPAALRRLPDSGLAGSTVVALTGLACFLTQWVAVILWVPPAQLSSVWIPGGVLLALALVTEPRRWPAVITAGAVGSALLLLTLRLVPPGAAVLLGLLAAAQTVGMAVAVRTLLHHPVDFAAFREFLAYLAVVVIGSMVAASLVFLAAALTGVRPATFLAWRTFVLATLLGYLTTTPTVMLLIQPSRPHRRVAMQPLVEAALLTLFLVSASGLVFSGVANRAVMWTGFAMTLPLLLIWSAVRFGILGASTSLLLVSVISTYSTSRGLGPFTNESPGNNTLSLQLFILGIGLPLQGLAILLAEHKRTRADLRVSYARLRGLNQELIAAREEEARRIARELHDDVGQRLAIVSIMLSRLRRTALGAAGQAEIAQLQEQTSSIGRSLRQISHQLHPAELEHVGLSHSIQLKCEAVREATGLDVRMLNGGDTASIPPEVALCLYRVTQEALTNVVRHSGAHRVDLLLRCQGEELLLQVADDGRGFAPAAPERRTGLGLRSAAERVHAVGGLLSVDSAPGAGTILRVVVPLLRAPVGVSHA